MKVYVLIEENSPALQMDANGTYNIIGVYKDWNRASKAALERAEGYKINNYKIVDSFDERPKGQQVGYSLYLEGDEDSPYWFNIVVEPMEVVEEVAIEFENLCTGWLNENTFSFAFDGGIDDEGKKYSISCEYHSDTDAYIFTRWYGEEEAEGDLTREQEEYIKSEMKKYINA